MKALRLLLFIIFLPSLLFAKTYTPADVPNAHLSDRTRYVSDPDGYMSAEARNLVDSKLRALTDSTTMETAVVIVSDIGQADPFDFGHKLATSWGIGQDDKDNGLLILFVMNNKQVRIHTGKGVEGILPDIACKRIIEEISSPRCAKDISTALSSQPSTELRK